MEDFNFLASFFVLIVLVVFAIPYFLRRVVPTNEVHIVQSRSKTSSYGKDMTNGNTYYEWPAALPVIGVNKTILPVSVFDLDLTGYEAYDKGRLPFVVDIKAFFRITDSDVAAQRVASFEELREQLKAVVQGAVRTILASNEIEEIMQGRSKFGEEFTAEVGAQLSNWGVSTVKNIELMDIRDHKDSNVIKNIMEKKKSHIEMQSRTEVAKNMQAAQIAEIEAQKQTSLQQQQALQEIGQRTAEKDKLVGISVEVSAQEIKEQQRMTKEKEMNVLRVEEVKKAEIEKEKNLVQAEQAKQSGVVIAEGEKQKSIIQAEGNKQKAILQAEGYLQTQKLGAEGIKTEGEARAEAEKAMQLAPISAQITLAKEIGENQNYQHYLLSIRKIEADQAIGIKQAEALKEADLKVIANTGQVTDGISKVMDIFSAKGGTEIGGMLEGLAQTEQGKNLLNKFMTKKEG
ncbi:MAG: SPFH domain-containing protein [Pseudomonadota bacterium]